MNGLIRVAAAVPSLALGDVAANVNAVLEKLEQARKQGVSLVVFPELCLTGYSLGDLFFQKSLIRELETGVKKLCNECPNGIVGVVGLPVFEDDGIYNCALVFSRDELHGLVPKMYLPNYNEFYEKRWFLTGANVEKEVLFCGRSVLLSAHQIFCSRDGVPFGVEICEDLWVPIPPSAELCLSGARLILNLSASNELIGKRVYRRDLVNTQSAKCQCGYIYASAGTGESSSDLVFSGHSLIASCGSILAESEGWLTNETLVISDIDLDRIEADRRKQTSFSEYRERHHLSIKALPLGIPLLLPDSAAPILHVSRLPFVPSDEKLRGSRCEQIFAMQAAGLARRLRITGGKAVIGISGGLDSTLALLVACEAMDSMSLPRTNIIGVTMPCFGTSDRTHENALKLMRSLGITAQEISIKDAVLQHFRDIGHSEEDHSTTYENAQARERTQVLMDLANSVGGIVIGTGDLSEIALGWCTYNADHMSMYNVNCGVPKTLVRWIVQTAAQMPRFSENAAVLLDILATPISPELLPPDRDGTIRHKTEDIIGPYELHDFFLYYCVRFGYEPKKIYDLCCLAFDEEYDHAAIHKWLKLFYRRFFSQQFKRNCMPDGVKVGSVALSPRGDWRMPSDAVCRAWIEQCDAIAPHERKPV